MKSVSEITLLSDDEFNRFSDWTYGYPDLVDCFETPFARSKCDDEFIVSGNGYGCFWWLRLLSEWGTDSYGYERTVLTASSGSHASAVGPAQYTVAPYDTWVPLFVRPAIWVNLNAQDVARDFTAGGLVSSQEEGTEYVGTWKLDYAHDYDGNEYDIAAIGSDSVVLVVTSDTAATFYYFDDDAFAGTLSRDSSQDSYYSVDGFTAKCYDLTGSDGSYWEFAYITPDDGSSDPFFYLEVGPDGDYDSLYLAKA